MAKFCGNCGCELNEAAVFCSNCGSRSGEVQASPMPGYSQNGYPQVVYVRRSPVPGRGFGITSLVLGLVNLLPVLFLCFSWLSSAFLVGAYNSRVNPQPISEARIYQFEAESDYYSTPYGLTSPSSSRGGFVYEDDDDAMDTAAAILLLICFGGIYAETIMTVLFARTAKRRGYVNGISNAGSILGYIEFALCTVSGLGGLLIILFTMN